MDSVERDGATIRYDDEGTGRPIVFVHGGWLDRTMWQPQVDALAGDYRTVTVDLRGHGDTGGTDHRRYTVRDFASDVGEVIHAVTDEGEKPVLCGLSLGGIVAQYYAAARPNDVAGIVLAGTVRSIPPVPLTSAQKRFFFPKPAVYGTIRTIGVESWFRSNLRSIRSAEGHRWLALDDDVHAEAVDTVTSFDTSEYVKVFDALYDFDGVAVDDSVPALVLHGDHEAGQVVSHNRDLAERLDAERVTIPNAGHLSNRDNPDAFTDALRGFLVDEVESAPACD